MIQYKKEILKNGLTVVVNRDCHSKLAAVNLLYKIGAKNENPARTGFAHLFEHLMFRGTELIPDFDTPVQMACGENNAFTNNDYTDFYITLPKDNLETALWLESDRMVGLQITDEVLETEKRVVIEEFKQRFINQPYGDQMALLRGLCYRVHPYRWSTIGLEPSHVENASLEDVKEFYKSYYRPSNAILSISCDMEEEEMISLAKRWFEDIPDSGDMQKPPIEREPVQSEPRRAIVERDVPATSIMMAFHMGERLSKEFYYADLATDLLAGGDSARLYDALVRRRGLFSTVNAYILGSVDEGLFILSGQLLPTTSEEEAEEALLGEARMLCSSENISDYELEKVKNKFEANTLFGELNVMNKAMNLGFYEMLGDLELINKEVDIFRSVTKEQVASFCRNTLTDSGCSTLIYRAKNR